MPTIPENAPTLAVKFMDIDLTAPLIFTEGMTVDSPMARFFNRALVSTVGNAYSGDIRRALAAEDTRRAEAFKAKTLDTSLIGTDAKGKPAPLATTIADLGWDHQAKFIAKFEDYDLSASRGSGTSKAARDPITARVRLIAGEAVKALLVKKDLSVRTYMTTKREDGTTAYNHLVGQYIGQHPELVDVAKAQIEAEAAATNTEEVDGLDFDLLEAPAADPEAADVPPAE